MAEARHKTPTRTQKARRDRGVGHVGQAQHTEDDHDLGRHQPGRPAAEAVRQGTPQDLEAPGQAQEAQDADLLQGHPPAAQVERQGGVDEPEGHPLGKVEDEHHQKFQVPGQVGRGLGGHGHVLTYGEKGEKGKGEAGRKKIINVRS